MENNTMSETTKVAAATQTPNPFDKFSRKDAEGKVKTYTADIKSLGAEITYRKLSMTEDDAFTARILKNKDASIEVVNEIKYEKIAKMLIDPKVTVKQLKDFETDVDEVIIEILNVVGKSKMVDEEGNLES